MIDCGLTASPDGLQPAGKFQPTCLRAFPWGAQDNNKQQSFMVHELLGFEQCKDLNMYMDCLPLPKSL